MPLVRITKKYVRTNARTVNVKFKKNTRVNIAAAILWPLYASHQYWNKEELSQ